MKITLSVILNFLLLSQAFYLPVKVLWLESQRSAIARDLCINRDEPQLMCQGNCYINQAVAESVEEGHAENSFPAAGQQEQRAFSPFLPGSLLFPVAPVASSLSRPSFELMACCTSLPRGIFRPPRQYV